MHPTPAVYTSPDTAKLHALRAGLVAGVPKQSISVSDTSMSAECQKWCKEATKVGLDKLAEFDSSSTDATVDAIKLEEALASAAVSGNLEVVEKLIMAGVHRTIHRAPALAAAALGRQAEAARMLLRAGVSRSAAVDHLKKLHESDAVAWLGRIAY
jgi:hypothetical protein